MRRRASIGTPGAWSPGGFLSMMTGIGDTDQRQMTALDVTVGNLLSLLVFGVIYLNFCMFEAYADVLLLGFLISVALRPFRVRCCDFMSYLRDTSESPAKIILSLLGNRLLSPTFNTSFLILFTAFVAVHLPLVAIVFAVLFIGVTLLILHVFGHKALVCNRLGCSDKALVSTSLIAGAIFVAVLIAGLFGTRVVAEGMHATKSVTSWLDENVVRNPGVSDFIGFRNSSLIQNFRGIALEKLEDIRKSAEGTWGADVIDMLGGLDDDVRSNGAARLGKLKTAAADMSWGEVLSVVSDGWYALNASSYVPILRDPILATSMIGSNMLWNSVLALLNALNYSVNLSVRFLVCVSVAYSMMVIDTDVFDAILSMLPIKQRQMPSSRRSADTRRVDDNGSSTMTVSASVKRGRKTRRPGSNRKASIRRSSVLPPTTASKRSKGAKLVPKGGDDAGEDDEILTPKIRVGSQSSASGDVLYRDDVKEVVQFAFLLPIKLAVGHSVLTFTTWYLVGAPFPYIATTLSFTMAFVQLMWVQVVFPGLLWSLPMGFVGNNWSSAIIIIMSQLSLPLWVDSILYPAELPFPKGLTGLAVVMGYWSFGVQGIMYGPLLLCMLSIFTKMIVNLRTAVASTPLPDGM